MDVAVAELNYLFHLSNSGAYRQHSDLCCYWSSYCTYGMWVVKTLKKLTFYGKYGNIRKFFMVRCVVEGEHGLAASTCAPTHVGDMSLNLAPIFSSHYLLFFLHFSLYGVAKNNDKKIKR